MSAKTLARWEAISKEEENAQNSRNLKRHRSNESIGEEGYFKDHAMQDEHTNEGAVDEDDDISLVSRSPSPVDMDVDAPGSSADVNAFDKHVRGYVREVVTVETRIKSTNKGFGLLAKMGWVEGQPLGLSGDGRVDPIPFTVKNDMTGLGKISQDYAMIESTVSQRRNLDSERMQHESVDQRRAREDSVAQKATIQSEISSVLKPFYCELCDKQFQNVAQYDEHTNSYAHHHRARMRDMQANHPVRMSAGDAEARKEKERRREEKELRKIAKAAGVKITLPSPTPGSSSRDGAETQIKGGWASVGSGSPAPAAKSVPVASSSGGRGWASVSTPAAPAAPRWSAPKPSPDLSGTAASPPLGPAHTPAFRSSGWTESTVQVHTEQTLVRHNAEVPPNDVSQRGGWAATSAPVHPGAGRLAGTTAIASASSSSTLPVSSEALSVQPAVSASIATAPAMTAKQAKKAAAAAAEELANKARGNWQSFKKGGRR